MTLAALFGQLTVATKIACSQTLYFLFKVHRAHMIKNKNVLEKKRKKNRTTSVYRLLRKCEAFDGSFTKATRQLKRKHVFGSSSQSLSFFVSTLIPPMQDGGCFGVYRNRPDKYPSHLNPSSNPTVDES